ncbi:HAD family hydrolase [Burkholderia alba]|uniref:HAD family hydrolase n=1 Tax=Burkholderia alba TaxID=2683677 RepID=UPI002B0582C5|nr:HAD-IA family hydrolase [Burkholderia alba]
MTVKAVAFDFDLTLADSSAAVTECTRHALSEMGMRDVSDARIFAAIGLPLPATFTMLAADPDPARADEFARRFVARADQVMVPMTRLYEDVPALFSRLRAMDVAIAIVSSKFRHRIEAILDAAGMRERVDLIVGHEDVGRHKPHPDGLLLALARLAVPVEHAVYVGDHEVDALAAQAAGIRFIGAVTGTTSHEGWRAQGHQAVGRSIGEIASLLPAA